MLSSSHVEQTAFSRVIWLVLDGVGAGEMPDARQFGDEGSDTLGNLSRAFFKTEGRTLALPHLARMGLGNLTDIAGVPRLTPGQGIGISSKALEQSAAKDTTSGHWEMAGLVVSNPFKTFPTGFPRDIVDRWIRENNLPGVLGNCAASGTEIIERLGDEHRKTGKPILYTSADSVWQVAAHETDFGLDRLYEICKSARKICDELSIGRVIARPFVGDPATGKPYQRTYHRKDYAQIPFQRTYLDALQAEHVHTLGVGKISNIYAGCGISENIDTEGNDDGMDVVLKQMDSRTSGLIFCNLIDFDMLYGHRRNVKGFGHSLEAFDQNLGILLGKMGARDLLLITADHGNDPTFKGTDHTREYIPFLAHSPALAQGNRFAGVRNGFADVGATVFEALTGKKTSSLKNLLPGQSLL